MFDPTVRKVAYTFGTSALTAIIVLGGAEASSAIDETGFGIEINLSEQAADQLVEQGEGISLLVSYYGWPTQAAEEHADEVGQIDLGNATIDLPDGPEYVHLSVDPILAERREWLEGPISVNVNVFSSRRSGPDNILNCDFIDDEISTVVASSPVTLHCALIEETP